MARVVGSRDAPSPGHRRRPRGSAREQRECLRRAATCASARRRTSSRPTRSRRSRRSTSSRRRRRVRPADRAQGRATRAPTTPHRARQGRRHLGGRQDDHLPPGTRHPLVGRQAVHERRRALDVQRRAAEQDEPAPRHDRGGQVGLGDRTRRRSSCTSRRATPSSWRSSRCRSCPSTSGRSTRSRSSTRSTGRSRR